MTVIKTIGADNHYLSAGSLTNHSSGNKWQKLLIIFTMITIIIISIIISVVLNCCCAITILLVVPAKTPTETALSLLQFLRAAASDILTEVCSCCQRLCSHSSP